MATTVDYTDEATAIDLVKKTARTLDEAQVKTLLSDTAGKDKDGAVVYRPYYASAVLLDIKLQQIVKAEGAEFRDLAYNILALKEHQWSLDEGLGLVVPMGQGRQTATSSRRRTTTVRRNVRI